MPGATRNKLEAENRRRLHLSKCLLYPQPIRVSMKNLQSFLKGAKQVLEGSTHLTMALLSGEEDDVILQCRVVVCWLKLQVEFIIEADGWDP